MGTVYCDEGVINMLEAVFKTAGDDYKLLWYVKTHFKNGEEWYLRSIKGKTKKENYGDCILMSGCACTVKRELIVIENYIKYMMPEHAEAIIKYLRSNSDTNEIKSMFDSVHYVA